MQQTTLTHYLNELFRIHHFNDLLSQWFASGR